MKRGEREIPVTDADLEPGLAWMVMATEEGAMLRLHDGNLSVFSGGGGALGSAFAFPFPPRGVLNI